MLYRMRSIHQKRPRAVLTIAACCALMFVQCGKKAGDGKERQVIQVKGSDTMVNLAQAWAEAYASVDSTVEIEVSGGGSGVGIAALTKGTIDIANASRNMKQEEIESAERNTGKKPGEIVVGFDALAVYVHKDNPMDEISIEQLNRIFSENGDVTRWSQLGVKLPGAGNDEIVRVSRQSSSGTYEFFREHVLQQKDFKLGSRDMNGSKEVVELVGSTQPAIGYSGMGYATAAVKMLRVEVKTGEPGIAPTLENAQNKSYPLARPLLVYTLGTPEGAVKKYIDWLLSPAGQKIVEESGYVPLNVQ